MNIIKALNNESQKSMVDFNELVYIISISYLNYIKYKAIIFQLLLNQIHYKNCLFIVIEGENFHNINKEQENQIYQIKNIINRNYNPKIFFTQITLFAKTLANCASIFGNLLAFDKKFNIRIKFLYLLLLFIKEKGFNL